MNQCYNCDKFKPYRYGAGLCVMKRQPAHESDTACHDHRTAEHYRMRGRDWLLVLLVIVGTVIAQTIEHGGY